MPPLRILFLAPQPFFEVRGTPLAVLAMVKALTACGHSVDLLAFPQGEDVDVTGVRLMRSLSLPVGRVRPGPSMAKLALDVPFMARAAWRIIVGRYDVVHAVEEAAHLAAPVAAAMGVPLVMDIDSSIPDQLRYSGFAARGPIPWAAETMERFALRRAVAVITVCRSLTDGVRAKAPRLPIFQIEDPPLVERIDRADPQVARLKAELGLGEEPIVLYSGNFEGYQGVELLVDTAALLPGTRFLFMGGSPAHVDRLRVRALGAGAGGRVTFAGTRPPSQLAAFLGAASVLVSPRMRGENTPFKIYTYMASGVPLVATNIASHAQVVDDETAFLCEPTVEGLAAALRECLENSAESRRRAANARSLVEREYSKERYEGKVRRAYDQISRLAQGRAADDSGKEGP